MVALGDRLAGTVMRMHPTMIRRLAGVLAALLLAAGVPGPACGQAIESVRVKDLGRLQGWRGNALVGYGIVTGLAGTGDAPSNITTRQTLADVFSQFNITVPAAQIQSRNVAVVLVSADLPPFAREGDTLDVTVTSAGDARSLVGGSLLLAPLKAPDGRVYALAQGALAVGGYRYDANGNVIQKNHPTVGSVPNGARVEVAMHPKPLDKSGIVTFVLADPDYTTASRLADAVNARLGSGTAVARDAEGIDIHVPDGERDHLVSFIARVENVGLTPDRRARVVIDERTGTVVAGGDVGISPVAISHGDLKIAITNHNTAVQPGVLFGSNPGVRTALVTNTTVEVDEPSGPGYLAPGSVTVADLVQSLARLKTNTRDVISILRSVKAAGALHAELVVQ